MTFSPILPLSTLLIIIYGGFDSIMIYYLSTNYKPKKSKTVAIYIALAHMVMGLLTPFIVYKKGIITGHITHQAGFQIIFLLLNAFIYFFVYFAYLFIRNSIKFRQAYISIFSILLLIKIAFQVFLFSSKKFKIKKKEKKNYEQKD